MAFARQYLSYSRSLGQDHRDPSTVERRMYGKFDSEEEYQETVRREEDFRMHVAASARLAILETKLNGR